MQLDGSSVADHRAGQLGETQEMGGLALVATRQPTEPGNPPQGPFDDVPMTPQPLGRLDTPAGDPGNDAPPTQRLPAGRIVVTPVRIQLARPTPRPAQRPARPHQPPP